MKKGAVLATTPAIALSILGRLDPRLTTDPIAVGKPCWILHPEHGADAVAFGKNGSNWKTKGQRLCVHGEQMVQVHGIYQKSVPIMIPELDCQPYTLIDEVVAPLPGSGLFIKWDTRYLVRDDLRIVVQLQTRGPPSISYMHAARIHAYW